MNTLEQQVAALVASKIDAGLVDIKFLHKNLDEGSFPQVLQDFHTLQARIREGQTKELTFGNVTLKRSVDVVSGRQLIATDS